MEAEDRLNNIENDFKEHISKDTNNAFILGKIEEKLEVYKENFERNWNQHKEFYDKINYLESENDKAIGGLKVLGALLIPIIVSVVISLIRSFMG